MPTWAVKQLRRQEPQFAADGRLTLLDLEVLEPGLVRVQGVWRKDYRHMITVTPNRLSFLEPGRLLPISMIGLEQELSNIPPRELAGALRNIATTAGISSDKLMLLRERPLPAAPPARSPEQIVRALEAMGVVRSVPQIPDAEAVEEPADGHSHAA